MNETLEAMVRALFKSWFVDFEPVKRKDEGGRMKDEIAELFPSRLVDSELGEVPVGWIVTTLGDLFPDSKDCVLTGPFGSHLHASDYCLEGVPLILVKHVVDGGILEDDLPLVGNHKVTELDRYRLKTGDIVFTRVGAVGRSAYIHSRYAGWLISGQMLRVRVPDRRILDSRYLAQIYLEPSFVAMVESHALGTTRPSLNTGILQSFRFLAPPIELQNSFARTVAPMDAKIQVNKSETRTLAALRDALLPKLISGEIRVASRDAERFIREAGA